MDNTSQGKPLSPCHCANMRRASRIISQLYNRMLAPSGLKIAQYSLLRHVAGLGPINMSELAKHMGLDRTTLVRNVKPLEEQGFISGAAGADLRTRELSITESGLEAMENATGYWIKAQQSLGNYLGPQQLEALLGLLGKVQAFPG